MSSHDVPVVIRDFDDPCSAIYHLVLAGQYHDARRTALTLLKGIERQLSQLKAMARQLNCICIDVAALEQRATDRATRA